MSLTPLLASQADTVRLFMVLVGVGVLGGIVGVLWISRSAWRSMAGSRPGRGIALCFLALAIIVLLVIVVEFAYVAIGFSRQ